MRKKVTVEEKGFILGLVADIDNPYVKALDELEEVDYWRIIHQGLILCESCKGLDALGALEILYKVGKCINNNKKL